MMAALAFVFSVSMLALVIWPKIFLYIRDKYLGGPKQSPITMLSASPQTHVFGLDLNPDNQRIKQLEFKVSQLKSELDKKTAECTNMSSRLQQTSLTNISEDNDADNDLCDA
jgi:hypothetical protein